VAHGGERPEHHPQPAHLTEPPVGAPGPHLLGIDHVRLAMPPGARAEGQAERFYEGVLGLRRAPAPREVAPRGGCWFEGPGVRVHLSLDGARPVAGPPPALVVDDLDALRLRIEAAGGAVRPVDAAPTTAPGTEDLAPTARREAEAPAPLARLHTHDPFGNRIELVQLVDPPAEMFRTMAEHAIFPLALVDREGTIRWVGASVERFFGWRAGDLIGRSFAKMVAPASRPEAYEAFAAVDEAYEESPWGGVGLPVDLMKADGTPAACELSVLTTRRSGLPWYVVNVRQVGYERALDLAVEAMAEGLELPEIMARLVGALEKMAPDSHVAIGEGWTGQRFAIVAGAASALLADDDEATPWARALASGDDVWMGDLAHLPAPLASRAAADGHRACWVHPVRAPGESEASAAIVIWRTRPGPPTRFTWTTVRRVGHLLRLTLQWHRSHRTLQYAATHDQLTGLANRHAFLERLAMVAAAGEGCTAVLFLDLDHFKPVNEDLGHPVGDRVLAIVAQRLLEVLRPGDIVARIGGDEFAVLCERLNAPDDVEPVAGRLLAAVRETVKPLPEAATEVQVDASIGVTELEPHEPVESTLARVDRAMREAKATGRGRWVRHRLR
jgi:diguanylate cyclase (GGDEF)-like protein/PAS domain S-box-containing protein